MWKKGTAWLVALRCLRILPFTDVCTSLMNAGTLSRYSQSTCISLNISMLSASASVSVEYFEWYYSAIVGLTPLLYKIILNFITFMTILCLLLVSYLEICEIFKTCMYHGQNAIWNFLFEYKNIDGCIDTTIWF